MRSSKIALLLGATSLLLGLSGGCGSTPSGGAADGGLADRGPRTDAVAARDAGRDGPDAGGDSGAPGRSPSGGELTSAGGVSTGGGYSLASQLGRPFAAVKVTGGGYVLRGSAAVVR